MQVSHVRRRFDMATLSDGVARGDHAALARVLTLLERGDPAARSLVADLAAGHGHGYAIGITGAPGAGKSSLTDQLIQLIRAGDERVSVLAIDPSSPKTGGAILGDRVRMSAHATDPGVFIRSMATRGQLGGLAAVAPDGVRLLRSTGSPWVLVETVGVGQVELDIAGMADTTILVVYPGWGDSVQANKAGLLEVADILVVNKSDRPGAAAAVRDLVAMQQLTPHQGWTPPVVETVGTSGAGVDTLWQAILSHRDHLIREGLLTARRVEQRRAEATRHVKNRLSELADDWCQRPAFDLLVHQAADPHRIADVVIGQIVGAGHDTDPPSPRRKGT